MTIVVALALAGCGDPSAPPTPRVATDGPPTVSHPVGGLVDCEVTIASAFARPIAAPAPEAPSIECGPTPDRRTGGKGLGRVVFATDTILERFSDIGFTYGTPSWSTVLGTVSVPIRVVNLITKPLGTSDGVHAAANGTRVFIVSGPTVLATAGLGILPTIAVNNSTGTSTFTAPGQMYFQYAGIIKPDSASAAVTWTFGVLDVGKFNFQVGVDAVTP